MKASAGLLERTRVLLVDRAALGIDACEQPEPVEAIGRLEEPGPQAFSGGFEVRADRFPRVPANRLGGPPRRGRTCDAPVDFVEEKVG